MLGPKFFLHFIFLSQKLTKSETSYVNLVSVNVPACQRRKGRSEVLEIRREGAYAAFAPLLPESEVYSNLILIFGDFG
jgi:hypothetical protein